MSNHPLPFHNIKINKRKSLLAILENVIKGGDNYTFRNLYATEDGKEVDILEDGRNSCGVFVSWILLTMELIKRPHATVYATERDLVESDWHEIKEPKEGSIIIWEKKKGNEGLLGHKEVEFMHMGFCVSPTEVISNSSKETRFPRKHHITFGTNPDGTPVRKIEKILWHPELDNN